MNNFLRPNKSKLKNAQHYSLLEAFQSVLTAAGFTATKLVTLIATFAACFANENHWYMQARISEIINRRDQADKRRDRLYSKFHQLVKVWLESGNAAMEEAAEALVKVFKLYKLNTQAQLDEETGVMDNLITDLSTTEMLAHIETLGATWLFQQMVEAHNLVKSIRLEQGLEESEKVVGALEEARKRSDAAYNDVIAMIEALSLTAEDTAPYEAFIRQWNGTLKIYADIIDRKSGTSTAGNSANGNGSSGQGTTPTPSQGEGTEQGSDNGGGDNGGTTPPSGGGDDNGGDDNGGGEQGGDDNGSTDSPQDGGGETPPAPVIPTLTITKQGTGTSTVTIAGNAVNSGSQIGAGTQVDIAVTPSYGQTPTATLNGQEVELTLNASVYEGSFQMPQTDATLIINSGSSGGVDQN